MEVGGELHAATTSPLGKISHFTVGWSPEVTSERTIVRLCWVLNIKSISNRNKPGFRRLGFGRESPFCWKWSLNPFHTEVRILFGNWLFVLFTVDTWLTQRLDLTACGNDTESQNLYWVQADQCPTYESKRSSKSQTREDSPIAFKVCFTTLTVSQNTQSRIGGCLFNNGLDRLGKEAVLCQSYTPAAFTPSRISYNYFS
jgi:hypothetical protein